MFGQNEYNVCNEDIRTYLQQVDINFDEQTDFFKQKLKLLELSIDAADREKKVQSIGDKMRLYSDSVQQLKTVLPTIASHNIDAICDMLMAPDILLYWHLQPPDFQDKLKTLLLANENTESIFQALMKISDCETMANRSLATRASVPGVQELNSSIGNQELVSENVQKLVSLIELSTGIEIFGPVNQDDGSAMIIIEAAANALKKSDIKHVMFAVGPGHWYWVTISKLENQGALYAVEVFDPYCRASENIYQFLTPLLTQHGITSIVQTPVVNNRMIKPQNDNYSCGYYAAAYAHLKVQQLDNTARCNQDMINALRHGNSYNDPYLRNVCLHAVSPSKGLPPPEYANELSTVFWHNQEASSRVWDFRGGQRAFYSTIFVEGAILGLNFAVPALSSLLGLSALSSLSFPPLFAIMFIAAVATIYVSNRYERIVRDTSNSLTLASV